MRLRFCCKLVVVLCVSMALCPGHAFAQPQAGKRWQKRWIVSAVMLAAASFADACTSRGKLEANPALRDPLGRASMGRMAALKTGSAAGTLLLEYVLARKSPSAYKAATIVNFCISGAFAASAIRNASIPEAPRAP